ncbi:MAG: maltose alpha-D-glucosyltransferase [Candidatus Abyssubacteria bacterium]
MDREKERPGLEDDPLWYRDSIIYEAHVRGFRDSNDDGVGDFKGLAEKLSYLQDLGITCIWLLPFCPSPLKDDGYDISDYTGIHSSYGTMRDFKIFLREAHRRGIRVIVELPLNHTSDQHPWFQRARRAASGNAWRDFYVWSDTPERYKDARIIFKDFESSNWAWDPVASAYYWHRFYSHQPDLNYDNPAVERAIMKVIDFWFGMGVDGLRLDAIPYLYEREGTNCENLPETYAFIRRLRAHVDGKFRNKMLLAEANQWPEDASAYFGEGDQCHMAFHFPLMPRLFMALRMEDRFPIIDILEQTPSIPDTCQWAIFLRNHDELTLEMVTDEERDYMYRVYAEDPQMRVNLGIRRRLAPLLGNHRRRIELMNGLLFSLPGTPVLYYGDEIGMGDNIYLGDRNGVRTPMQWSADRNAGFSRANPQQLYLPIIIDPEYHYETVNVETQQRNPHSLLWWMKRMMAVRKNYKAFGRGAIEFLHPENRKVLAFIRRHDQECILVVANLSRFVQYVELDLRNFQGMVPVEVSGRVEFPDIGELPYLLTLGPHSFYWFSLESKRAMPEYVESATWVSQLPTISVSGTWETVFGGRPPLALEKVFREYLPVCRWFGGKGSEIKTVGISRVRSIANGIAQGCLAMLEVEYVDGESETYSIPLTYSEGDRAEEILRDHPRAAVARLQLKTKDQEGLIHDATVEQSFCEELLRIMSRRRSRKDREGELIVTPTRAFRRLRGPADASLEPRVLKGEQSNTSVIFGERFILKLFRRIAPGMNPDLEIGRFLTERGFTHIPQVASSLEYRAGRQQPVTLAILHGFVPNQGDAWEYTLDVLEHFFEQALTQKDRYEEVAIPNLQPLDLVQQTPPPEVAELIGAYLESVRLLGRRTAELHVVLASEPLAPDFSPEPFSKLYQRSIYQSMRSLTAKVFQSLTRQMRKLPEKARNDAEAALDLEDEILNRFRSIIGKKITAMRIRCHGDYHLGQVLYTGKDFVIIDFEGEPARPISERRIKRSPLRDVAGMLRSFHYAAYSAFFKQQQSGIVREDDFEYLEKMAGLWSLWVGAVFLTAYLEVAGPGGFLPTTTDELELLLNVYLLEKAVYELGYELNNRPDWIRIPLQGIAQLLQTSG